METKTEYKINVGLLKADMTTQLNKTEVLTAVTERLLKIGVTGFNSYGGVGFWNSKPEPCLNVSFIDSFDEPINPDELKNSIELLKTDLSQDSILLSRAQIEFEFI